MTKILLPFLFAAALQAQTLPILINAGSSQSATGPSGTYLPDQGFTGGAVYGPVQQPTLSAQTGIYQTLRYGPSFSWDAAVPIATGTCAVKFNLLENRPAVSSSPSLPASGPGLRQFTITVNGQSSGILDLFTLAGAQTPYVLSMPAVPVTAGRIHADWLAVPNKGNAVDSGVEVTSCTPSVPPTSGISGTFNCDAGVSLTIVNGSVTAAMCTSVIAGGPLPSCPVVAANTIRSTWLANSALGLAHQDSSGRLDCAPGTRETVIVDAMGTPLGVYVPDPQNFALIDSRAILDANGGAALTHIFGISPLHNPPGF